MQRAVLTLVRTAPHLNAGEHCRSDMIDLLSGICNQERSISLNIFLAIEIAREGREGRKLGTLFVVADEKNTLQANRSFILDPLWNHPETIRHVEHPDLRETVKELAQLDGAFIVSDDGTFLSACRYIDSSSQDVRLPLGLGSRHMAAASITSTTKAVAVVVSESSIVRVFEKGVIIAEILPEMWLLHKYSLHMPGQYFEKSRTQCRSLANRVG